MSSKEGSHSGLVRTPGKRMFRKKPGVRIPPSPQTRILITQLTKIYTKILIMGEFNEDSNTSTLQVEDAPASTLVHKDKEINSQSVQDELGKIQDPRDIIASLASGKVTIDNNDAASSSENEVSNLQKKLLSPEEVVPLRGTNDKYTIEGKNGRKIAVAGNSHTHNIDAYGEVVRMLISQKPDIVLVENMAFKLELVDSLVNSEISDKEVMERHGEQVYLAWLAKKSGIEVQGWDIPANEQIALAITELHTSIEDIAAQGVLMGMMNAKQSNETVNLETLVDRGIKATGLTLEQAAIQFGLPADKDKLQELIRTTIDKMTKDQLGESISFDKISLEQVRRMADPAKNPLYNFLVRLRDKRAMETIYQASKTYKSIFVTSGSDHARMWRPALNSLEL